MASEFKFILHFVDHNIYIAFCELMAVSFEQFILY